MAQTAPNGLPLTDDASCVKFADFAVHPGEDATLDRNWGGWKGSGTYISTATTTLVKTGAGVVHCIMLGETAAGGITLFDGLSSAGTVMCVLKSSIAEGTYILDREFTTGLTILTSAASKLSVTYR